MKTFTAAKFGDLKPGDRFNMGGGPEAMKIEVRVVLGTVPGHHHTQSKAAQAVTAVSMAGALFYIDEDALVTPTFPVPTPQARASHSSLAAQMADGAIERR